ncbi:hypothetical protein K469DRAFT_704537 [Zopfia rhizophila CBS 207.26]|uniref:Uncharacterized protein n=1 Tax=Zopfia rhizophila CBS 207.26 TaxID=1314779 RepID=A0A6A6E922_9PEZI|nr:hypothetical protein K469DRAFT_704537 [Zopfia rhizophila CBS 207.26]
MIPLHAPPADDTNGPATSSQDNIPLLARSRSSSVMALRPASLYPPSPALNPVASSHSPPMMRNLPSPTLGPVSPAPPHANAACLDPVYSTQHPATWVHRKPITQNQNPSPMMSGALPVQRTLTALTQATQTDDVSEREKLVLRRMSSLVGVLEGFDVDGRGRFSFDAEMEDVRSDDGNGRIDCESGWMVERGRSTVRQGDRASKGDGEVSLLVKEV